MMIPMNRSPKATKRKVYNMALKIIDPKNKSRNHIPFSVCEILADAEDDITGMGEVVTDGRITVKPAPGSFAYTADMSAVYQLSPSEVWTKI